MKTVNEFYEEIRWNKQLWEAFDKAAKDGRAEAFMKEHECGASFEELTNFLQSQKKDTDIEQLSLEALEKVVGGFPTIEECLRTCFVSEVYVPWLDEICPKCEFYLLKDSNIITDERWKP